MDIINDKNFSSENRTVVTFGKFDGIHTGHKLLINKAVAIAEKEGLTAHAKSATIRFEEE